MKKTFKTLAVCFLFVIVGCLFACGKGTQAPTRPSTSATGEATTTVTVTGQTTTTESNQTTTTEAPHSHTWDEGVVTTPATCTEEGVKTFTCECGETKTEGIDALGHDEVNHDAQAATCEEAGWNAYVTCSRCEYTTYQEIQATGHSYATTYSYNDQQHYYACTNPGCEAISGAQDHTGGEATIIEKPTCTACGNKYGDYLPGPRKYNVKASINDYGLFYVTNATPLAEGETLTIEIKVIKFEDLGGSEDIGAHWTSVQHMDSLDLRHPVSGDGTFWIDGRTAAPNLTQLSYKAGDVIVVTLKANGPATYKCGSYADSTSSGAGSYFGFLINGFNFNAEFEITTYSAETVNYGVNVYGATSEMIEPKEYLHIHEFGTTLAYNEEGHWYSCTHEGCEEKGGFEAHKGGTATLSEKAICEVCNQPYGSTLTPKYYTIDFVNQDADPVYFGNMDARKLAEAMTIEFTVASLTPGTSAASGGYTSMVCMDGDHTKVYASSAEYKHIYLDGTNDSISFNDLNLEVGVTYKFVIQANGAWQMTTSSGKTDSSNSGEHDFYGFGIYPYNFNMKLVNVRIYSDSVVDYGVYAFNGGTAIYNTTVTLQEGIVE